MEKKAVRVRFAPSPTGALHIGGVRTALYNYLWAKKHGGTFILRIEDTDQTRYVEGAEAYIMEALEWLGIEPDESPKKGGDYGPYRQSERKAMYGQFAEQLIKEGKAYYAFDTPEELDAARAKVEAETQGKGKFKYDASTRMDMRNSLSLDANTTKQYLEKGEYVVRFKLPAIHRDIIFEDAVRGTVTYSTEEMDDKVLFKSDGMPTYHLANIVDDYHMKITHVIRGEEWLPSTPLHVLLYEAFGWADARPQFAHLSLILKPAPDSYLTKQNKPAMAEKFLNVFLSKQPEFVDNKEQLAQNITQLFQDVASVTSRLSPKKKDKPYKLALKAFLKKAMSGKLSKRDGDLLGFPVFPLDWNGDEPFRGFREWGFLPQAVLNFLALLGWNSKSEQEIFTLEELVDAFDLDEVVRSGARFDYAKAKWFNQQYMIKGEDTVLAEMMQPLATAKGYTVSKEYLTQVANLLKQRVEFVPEFIEKGSYFFSDLDFEVVKEKEGKNLRKRVLNKWSAEKSATFMDLHQTLSQLAATDDLEPAVDAFMESKGLGKGEVMPALRFAISGTMGGPALYEMMEVIGRAKSLDRIKAFVEFCNAETTVA